MNANIMKMHNFWEKIIDLKGHRRSQKVKSVFKNYLKITTACHHVESLNLSLQVSNFDMHGVIQNM